MEAFVFEATAFVCVSFGGGSLAPAAFLLLCFLRPMVPWCLRVGSFAVVRMKKCKWFWGGSGVVLAFWENWTVFSKPLFFFASPLSIQIVSQILLQNNQ